MLTMQEQGPRDNLGRGKKIQTSPEFSDLFKKLRDTKGTFHAKMGTIKDRNGMDLTKAEDIKRDGKNTQRNYTKKIFMTQISTIM